jgi:L-ascorbate metabolism protein UlaG (beta-lactamase superfamily)
LPKADLILVTHEHGDHLDVGVIRQIRKEGAEVVLNQTSAGKIDRAVVMKNGDVKTVKGLRIEATPAYNIVHKRGENRPFHPKGNGNGYVISFGDKRVYIAGDTENIPEMRSLKNIDIAFLPMNLPYTMTPEMAAAAAKSFMPKILYPYHFGDTDVDELLTLLKNVVGVEVRVRAME